MKAKVVYNNMGVNMEAPPQPKNLKNFLKIGKNSSVNPSNPIKTPPVLLPQLELWRRGVS